MKFFVVLILSVVSIQLSFSQEIRTHPLKPALDSVTAVQWKIDSIRIVVWSDSLQDKIRRKVSFDSLNYSLKLDSLEGLGQRGGIYRQKLDSLAQKKADLLSEVQSHQQKLFSETRAKLSDWEAKVKTRVGSVNLSKIEGVNLPNAAVPELMGINMPDLGTTDLAIPDLPQLNLPDFEAGLSPDLGSLNKNITIPQLDKLSGFPDNLHSLKENMNSITQLTANPDNAMEQTLTQVGEVKVVTDELQQVEGLKNGELMQKVEMMKDPDAMKEEAKRLAVEEATRHFSEQNQVIESTMAKIGKLKRRYSSVTSLADLPKRPPNPMHGKPFIERIVPGISLQFTRKGDLLIDFNPYLGYRLSGVVVAGAGWNQRVSYSTDRTCITSGSVVYGPRFFGEVLAWRGFSARLEFEWMNTVIPPDLGATPKTDAYGRAWVFTPLAGIKKDYKLIGGVRGTVFVLLNLYNPKHRSPYSDVIYSRFGFEFTFKKKVRT